MSGPIGLLLQSCAKFGCTVDRVFNLRCEGSVLFNILHVPFQQLSPRAFGVLRANVWRAVEDVRG
eukprot:8418900-Alexandrium_andersonii.AAC.1